MTLDRKYEKFLGGPTQPTQERVYASISPQNVITVNSNCYRLLGKPPAVYLYFSRADDMIAIQPVESFRLPAAFPVRDRYSSGCKRINRIASSAIILASMKYVYSGLKVMCYHSREFGVEQLRPAVEYCESYGGRRGWSSIRPMR